MTVEYSQDELCDYIAKGKSLVSWCNLNNIGYSTIMAHLAKDKLFQEKYAHARENQADYLVDEIIVIADDVSQDVTTDAQGKYVVDGFASQRARLMVDTRKWVASKMKPKKYGERQTIAGDPEAPLYDIASIVKALDGSSAGLPEIKG